MIQWIVFLNLSLICQNAQKCFKKTTVFMEKSFMLGVMLRQYRMKKSLKNLYGGEENNLFPNGFIQVSGRKIILSVERNVLVNTLRFLIKSFITYLFSMTQEKVLSGASSNTCNGVWYFFLTFELFRQGMINQRKVKNMLKTISTRLKSTNLTKLAAFQHSGKIFSSAVESDTNIWFFLIFCYFNFLAFMLIKDYADNACIQAYTCL